MEILLMNHRKFALLWNRPMLLLLRQFQNFCLRLLSDWRWSAGILKCNFKCNYHRTKGGIFSTMHIAAYTSLFLPIFLASSQNVRDETIHEILLNPGNKRTFAALLTLRKVQTRIFAPNLQQLGQRLYSDFTDQPAHITNCTEQPRKNARDNDALCHGKEAVQIATRMVQGTYSVSAITSKGSMSKCYCLTAFKVLLLFDLLCIGDLESYGFYRDETLLEDKYNTVMVSGSLRTDEILILKDEIRCRIFLSSTPFLAY